ncbi:unnamed protein product [Closterium sp. NIES-65]|nr:unnamed protein product [Closterium sp. NIES-65]
MRKLLRLLPSALSPFFDNVYRGRGVEVGGRGGVDGIRSARAEGEGRGTGSIVLIAAPSTPLVTRHAMTEPSEAHRRLSSAHHLCQHCFRWSFQPVSPHLLTAMGSHSHGAGVRSLVLAALAALMLSGLPPFAIRTAC